MPDARLEVTDALGRRIVPIAKDAFGIGRRETNDLRLGGSEVRPAQSRAGGPLTWRSLVIRLTPR